LNTAITKYPEGKSEIKDLSGWLYGWRNYFFSNMLYVIQLKENIILKTFSEQLN
jgi:hypothetical protein